MKGEKVGLAQLPLAQLTRPRISLHNSVKIYQNDIFNCKKEIADYQQKIATKSGLEKLLYISFCKASCYQPYYDNPLKNKEESLKFNLLLKY